jgi:serine/threonine protein kinase
MEQEDVSLEGTSSPPAMRTRQYGSLQFIGSGTHSRVFSAVQKGKTEKVALKVVSRTHEHAVMAEVNILSQIKHPNVLRVLHHWGDKEHFYITTDLCASTVNHLIHTWWYSEDTAIPPASAVLHVIRDIACGLKEIHARGWVHRDIKPENVGITVEGRCRIFDFGLAVPIYHVSKGCAGTLDFMAPEEILAVQTNNEYIVKPQKDIWALGVVLYELVTGKVLFHSVKDSGIFATIAAGLWNPPQGVHSEILRVMYMLLCPADRRSDASLVCQYLDSVQ